MTETSPNIKKEPAVIDTNIIEGLGKKILSEYKKNTRKPLDKVIQEFLIKPDGILEQISNYYTLFTTRLTKYEFINSLKLYGGNVKDLRTIFDAIISKFSILIVPYEQIDNFLTDEFFDAILQNEVSLEDAMQVRMASKLAKQKRGTIFITGNTKHIEKMKKLYNEVFSVQQIYERLKKEGKSRFKK